MYMSWFCGVVGMNLALHANGPGSKLACNI